MHGGFLISIFLNSNFQIQNLHPFPKDLVCHRGRSWDQEARSWWEPSAAIWCFFLFFWSTFVSLQQIKIVSCLSLFAAQPPNCRWDGKATARGLNTKNWEPQVRNHLQCCYFTFLVRSNVFVYYVCNMPLCSYCNPGMVERDPGQEEGSAPTTGR